MGRGGGGCPGEVYLHAARAHGAGVDRRPAATAGDETHAGQVFCCVAALALADSLHEVDGDLLSWWCAPPPPALAAGVQASAPPRVEILQPVTCRSAAHGRVIVSLCTIFMTKSVAGKDALDRCDVVPWCSPASHNEGSEASVPGVPSEAALAVASTGWDRPSRRRLAERQTEEGGLNGRPEKLQDVCYSWWCLSALSLLGRTHWIDRARLSAFILQCQVRLTCATPPDACRMILPLPVLSDQSVHMVTFSSSRLCERLAPVRPPLQPQPQLPRKD